MKTIFSLTDETTITNTTVKVMAQITGTISGETREQIEARCLAAAKRLFDDKWAFSDFVYQPDGFTFRVNASTRIDASLNDQLTEKALTASDESTRLTIARIDPSIPTHEIRAAESDLRVKIIALAKAEAKKLKSDVLKVDFATEAVSSVANMKAMSFNATYSQEAPSGGGSPALGHSEKLSMTAQVTIGQ